MEAVIEKFKKLSAKEQMVRDVMVVIPHKPKFAKKLKEMSNDDKEIKMLEEEIKTSMEHHENILLYEYEELNDSIRRVQMKMMHLLQHFDDQDKHKQTEQRALKEIGFSSPHLMDRSGAQQAFQEVNTPRMLVSDYAKSPFAKKRTKIQLQFTDFEAEISSEDFSKIPAYMRGRQTLPELQDFLDNCIIKTFNDKYKTLHRHRSTLKPSEFTLQSMFRSQESYFEGQKFITVGDIARILEKNVDKRDERHLQMLRHLHIIKESRTNSVCCYIWVANRK
jgi:Spindle and kinetochore-associated protein 1